MDRHEYATLAALMLVHVDKGLREWSNHEEWPSLPFYAASLTKNAVGVFAHGKLRSPIF